jgi:hypothetical protein
MCDGSTNGDDVEGRALVVEATSVRQCRCKCDSERNEKGSDPRPEENRCRAHANLEVVNLVLACIYGV